MPIKTPIHPSITHIPTPPKTHKKEKRRPPMLRESWSYSSLINLAYKQASKQRTISLCVFNNKNQGSLVYQQQPQQQTKKGGKDR
jgi:hypothetical protein